MLFVNILKVRVKEINVSKNRAYRYRIYPTKEQQEYFSKNFGCRRFIYNKMLEDKISYYKENGKMLKNTPAQYKTQYPWLKEADSLALANTQLDLESAFRKFFSEPSAGFPCFKSKKKCRDSYTTNNQGTSVGIIDGKLKLPKTTAVKIKLHRKIPEGYKIKSATVSKSPSGKYYVSLLTEYTEDIKAVDPSPEKVIGLDYSSPHFYVDDRGNRADMPHYFRLSQKKLATEQRKLSRMDKGSRNYYKQRRKIALIHEKIHLQRLDWIHKLAKSISETCDAVCIEDLDMKRMAAELKLAKSTNDNSFGMFRNILAYKLEDQGKKLITINKWYPSSRTCSCCGYVYNELKLNERKWNCPQCRMHHDRDKNAAINIREKGLSIISA